MAIIKKLKLASFLYFFPVCIGFFQTEILNASEQERSSINQVPDDLISEFILPSLTLREISNFGASSSRYRKFKKNHAPKAIKQRLQKDEPESIAYQPVCQAIYQRVANSLKSRDLNKLTPGSAFKNEMKSAKDMGGGALAYGLGGTLGVLNEVFLFPVEVLVAPWVIKNYFQEKKYLKVLKLINRAYAEDLEYFERFRLNMQSSDDHELFSKLSASDLAKVVRIADRLKLFCPGVSVERFDDKIYIGFFIDLKTIPTIAEVRKQFVNYIYQVADFLEQPENHPRLIKKLF